MRPNVIEHFKPRLERLVPVARLSLKAMALIGWRESEPHGVRITVPGSWQITRGPLLFCPLAMAETCYGRPL